LAFAGELGGGTVIEQKKQFIAVGSDNGHPVRPFTRLRLR
jgi:hypothetical protein